MPQKLFRRLIHARFNRSRHKTAEHFYTPIVDLNNQTRQLEDGSRICSFLPSNDLIRNLYSDTTTLYEAVRRGARQSNNGPMLGARNKKKPGQPYDWIRYNDVIELSVDLAHGFQKLGLPAGQNTCVGVYSKNRPEWIIVEHATYNFSNVLVPLYDTFTADSCAYIINQAEIPLVVCETLSNATGLLEKRDNCPSLRHLIVMEDDVPNDVVKSAQKLGINLMTFKHLIELGRNQPRMHPQPPKPDDLATICYTSGTTGAPKGVMLTHGNIIADSTTFNYLKGFDLSNDDITFSFLPLAHMFERVVQSIIYTEGGRVGFFSGDIKELPDDLVALRPTIMPVVPRVLNRVHDKVMAEVNKSKIMKAIFDAAINYKMYELERGIVRNTSWADQIIFKKIRDSFGGRLKLMITGSAPVAEDVLSFTRCTLGCSVIEGYGQTESVAAVSITIEGDTVPGHVGVPIPCNAVKLVDVPELGYFARNNAGEVCIRGANVFRGYYKNEEETRNVLDSEGWLHTGDIGRWTDRGTLKIVDRKKHIFKLAQGEYVAPEKIEAIYTRSKYVAQSFVHGISLKNCLVGIIVPDREVLSVEAARLGLSDASLEELCKRDDIKKIILRDLTEIGDASELHGFEQVADIYLCPEPFSVENGLLTPTLKSKRPKLAEHFRNQIEAMYAKLD